MYFVLRILHLCLMHDEVIEIRTVKLIHFHMLPLCELTAVAMLSELIDKC